MLLSWNYGAILLPSPFTLEGLRSGILHYSHPVPANTQSLSSCFGREQSQRMPCEPSLCALPCAYTFTASGPQEREGRKPGWKLSLGKNNSDHRLGNRFEQCMIISVCSESLRRLITVIIYLKESAILETESAELVRACTYMHSSFCLQAAFPFYFLPANIAIVFPFFLIRQLLCPWLFPLDNFMCLWSASVYYVTA